MQYLIGVSLKKAAALIFFNAACSIEVVTGVTATALSTGIRTVNHILETRAGLITSLSTDLVVAVGRARQGWGGKIQESIKIMYFIYIFIYF